MMRCRRLLLLSTAFLLAKSCLAQGPATAQAANGPAVIHARANLVLVDVVVTDRGAAVRGLTKGQIHVFENGKEETVTVFEEHRADAAPKVGRPPALPPHVYSNYPQFAETSAANVLLLDALNTPLSDQQYVRRQMIEYLRKIPSGTRIAVFTLASRLRMVEGFTTDPAAIETAVTKGRGRSQPSVLLESAQDQDGMSDIAESMSGVDGGAMQQFIADTQSFQTDLRVQMTLGAMQELGRYLAMIPGRKNLIWFSGSFPLTIDPDVTLNDAFSAARQYADEVRQTDNLLTEARVAVYPVDARGLMMQASMDVSRSFASAPGMSMGGGTRGRNSMSAPTSVSTRAQKADAQFMQQTTHEHQTMDQIAEETGGRAFYDNNGLAYAVEQAIGNGSNYYTVGYVPETKEWDGKFRRIEVRVDGGKYELAYRRGYYADDPLKAGPAMTGEMSPVVAALERGAPPLSQIIFEARALSANDPEAKAAKVAAGPAGIMPLKAPVTRYLVDFSVDPREIAWSALPDGGAHAQVEVALVAWDADGKRVNYTDHAYAVNLSSQDSAAAAKRGLPIHQEIDLPVGQCWLRVAVHDLTTGRIGSLEIPLVVPKG